MYTNRTRTVYYNGTEYTVHISQYWMAVSVIAYRGLMSTRGHKTTWYTRH